MRILIVNSFYYPNLVGGCEHSVKLLAEGLHNNKNEVAVFTIDNLSSRGIVREKISNVEIFRCDGGMFNTSVRLHMKKNILNKILNKFVELHNNYVSKMFEKVVDDFKPDIIHTNNLYGLSPLIWKVAASKNVKTVHTIRDYWILDPTVENKERKNIFVKNYQHYFRKYSNYVDLVTAPSKFTLETLLKNNYFKNANSKVIQNCVNMNIKQVNDIIFEKNKRNSNSIIFIYVGMIDEKKGIINLLKAFSNINNDNISLLICGNGILENIVNDYCNRDKRISFLGQLSKNELNIQWTKADVCIVPSIWDEPFGRVVIEANQYGLPVIGSNKGGIKEILDNIKTGELFQYNDINDLTDKIKRFSVRDNIVKYYDKILNNIEYYSLENQIKMFQKEYERLRR